MKAASVSDAKIFFIVLLSNDKIHRVVPLIERAYFIGACRVALTIFRRSKLYARSPGPPCALEMVLSNGLSLSRIFVNAWLAVADLENQRWERQERHGWEYVRWLRRSKGRRMRIEVMALWAIWENKLWGNMFWLTLPVLEKMLRAIIVYIFLVMSLRIFGKRELAQLNPFDLVVLLTLSNTVQNAIIGEDNSVTGGLIGAFTLLLANYFVVRLAFKHHRLGRLLEGRPTVLVANGRIRRTGLAKELLTESELRMVALRQGFKSLNEVEECVLEPGGAFVVEGKHPSSGERQHSELMARLDQLDRQLAELRQQMRDSQKN
jgi:uncharacterized membrane protein YcaP (DUF421 family)